VLTPAALAVISRGLVAFLLPRAVSSAAVGRCRSSLASSTLTEPKWDDTTVLSDDVAAAVVELKAKPGRELHVHGSGALIRWLMNDDLVDAINLFLCPVVVGQGTRLFPDTGPDRAFERIESQTTPGGVMIQVYRPAGCPEYGTSTADLDHVG
jgi:dihydrofolate reductase